MLSFYVNQGTAFNSTWAFISRRSRRRRAEANVGMLAAYDQEPAGDPAVGANGRNRALSG